MSFAEITRLSSSGDLAYTVGDLNEKYNSAYSSKSTEMDYANNDAGIAAGKSSDSAVENSLNFIKDVVSGNVKVIDKDTGEVRETSYRDLPGTHDGDALDDRYKGDTGDPFGDPGGDGDTMIA